MSELLRCCWCILFEFGSRIQEVDIFTIGFYKKKKKKKKQFMVIISPTMIAV